MFSEEKCPNCGSGGYEVQDYEEDYVGEDFTRGWACKCSNCKSNFIITYYYGLKKIEVSEC